MLAYKLYITRAVNLITANVVQCCVKVTQSYMTLAMLAYTTYY
jgi:hypothetical protein